MRVISTENNWKTLSSETVYENAWLELSHRDVINPSGNKGIYGLVKFKNQAIGVIPVDADDNIYLVGQYRYAIDEYSWEIPEGGGALDADPLDAAKRELKEETGLLAGKWTKLARIHTSNSATNEEGFLFIAEELTQDQAEPEDTEDLQVWKLPLKEAVEMVMRSEITDSLSVAGILMTARLKGI
ncbi:NUDIX domain-containing protein [Dyadobacter fermentans]|uniref:GDP-mannose pyrophosphatase n=1 Tax=Dyadobacter fermentans (strain ATCC 700827 / DSM 18053 / CIP 107007 / KCTC 52180 / NS114) TaxID=471854 RepID=C6VZC8_DYAFD|nr:NUDIX hydrolase [Dyadobacter fermentans]ACT91740.1 NUDIX hydrolase [Dyadobacter fermentans DSM 18053]